MLSQQTEKERRSSMQCRLQRSLFSLSAGFDVPDLPVRDSFPSLLNPHSSAHINRWLCSAPVASCSYSPCLPGIILACSRKAREALEAKAEVMNINSSPSPVYVSLVTRDPLRSRHSHTAHPFCIQSSHSLSVNTIWQSNREISATSKCHIYQKFAALDSQGTYLRYK